MDKSDAKCAIMYTSSNVHIRKENFLVPQKNQIHMNLEKKGKHSKSYNQDPENELLYFAHGDAFLKPLSSLRIPLKLG